MIHNRQFILTKHSNKLFPQWDSEHLANGYVICHHPKLPIHINNTRTVAIIGDAWQVNPNLSSPHAIIERWDDKTSLKEIYKEEEMWCGRYLIVTPQYLLTDATGNLSCFYAEDAISSSFAILSYIVDNELITTPHAHTHTHTLCHPPTHTVPSPIVHTRLDNQVPVGINNNKIQAPIQAGIFDYMPGELTTCGKIRRLLPSQKLEYQLCMVSERPLIVSHYSNTDFICEFEQLFFSGIETMFRYYEGYKIWLPVSGGKDSRVCLAAFEKLKKKYQIFVFYNNNAPKHAGSYQDLGISRLLSKKIHKKILVVKKKRGKDEESKSKELFLHNSGLSASTSLTWQYPCDTLRPVLSSGEKVLRVNNSIWELVHEYYDSKGMMNTPQRIREKWRGSVSEQSIERWLEFVENDKTNETISLGNRAYWDLRLGCWLADYLQGCDIYDNMESINVLNCRKYISLLMQGIDAKKRATREFQIELANKWCPVFADVPYEESFNDIVLIWRKWKNKIIRMITQRCNRLINR